MSSVGKISLDLDVNSKGYAKQIDGIQKQTTKAFGAMSVAVGNIMSQLATKALSSIGSFVKGSIKAGSDIAELENVVDSVFTTMSDKVDAFADSALSSYGLTTMQSKKMIGTFGAMAKAFGNTEEQSFEMSAALTALAGDVSSFYNLSVDEAYTKLKSVFTGETESIKDLGVVMTQAALDEFAFARGISKTTAQMSEQEKVALRLAFVQDKLKDASGDVIRTQDSWANQTRKLTGQFESFKAAIGQGFIAILTPVIKVINELMVKLTELGNKFNNFITSIMGSKGGGGGAGAVMSEVANAASLAADSTGEVESSTLGAASAAKKAQKSLMGFDEINKLSSNNEGSSSGGSSSGFSTIGTSPMPTIETSTGKASGSIDKLKSKLDGIISLLSQGFKSGLGDDFSSSVGRMKEHVGQLGDSLKNIFTDPAVTSSASNWAQTWIYTVSQMIGSIVSVATSIGENLVGGIDKYLSQNKDTIKKRLVGMLDASSEAYATIGKTAKAIGSIFEVFRGDAAKQVTADLLSIVGNAGLGVMELGAKIGSDLINSISKPIIDNKDKIKQSIEGALVPIGTVVSTIGDSVTATFDKVFEVYDAKVRPALEGMAEQASKTFGVFLDAYNKYLLPVVNNLASKFSDVWESKVQPAINKVIEVVGKLANFIKVLWENVIGPFVRWLISTLVPILAPIFQTIAEVVMGVAGGIIEAIGGVIDVIGGIIDFLSGVFSGDWSLCWDGIKSIFEGFCSIITGLVGGLFDLIVGIFTAAVEILVGIVKFLWEAIVGIITTIIDAVVSLISTWLDLVCAIVSNAGEILKGIFTTIWNAIKGIVEGVLNAIKNVVSTVWNAITSIISAVVKGILNIISTVFNAIKSVVSAVFGAIKNIVSSVWNGILNVITGVTTGMKDAVSGALNFIKNLFSTVFGAIDTVVRSVFGGIWSFIKGIINTIIGGIEGMVNGVISGLNFMIGALNKLSFDVPDWVPVIGGKKFGFDLSDISKVDLPKLAQGGYVKANQPQPVIVGDNKTQGEIIAPEGKILEITMQALEAFFGKLMQAGFKSSNSDSGDICIPIYLDGTLLDEVIVTAQQRRNIRSGGSTYAIG